jgi:hypothetical protein
MMITPVYRRIDRQAVADYGLFGAAAVHALGFVGPERQAHLINGRRLAHQRVASWAGRQHVRRITGAIDGNPELMFDVPDAAAVRRLPAGFAGFGYGVEGFGGVAVFVAVDPVCGVGCFCESVLVFSIYSLTLRMSSGKMVH